MTVLFVGLMLPLASFAQVVTVGGGQTVRVSTKHDYARVEVNFPWREEIWRGESLQLSLHHAASLYYFTDKNDVWAVSWAPNFILAPQARDGFYPYLQFGIGVAVLSDDKFESDDSDPDDDGASDMGSNAQFENSVAVGLVREPWSIRAKFYHLSNAGLADPNGGMDVAEFGVSYRFQ